MFFKQNALPIIILCVCVTFGVSVSYAQGSLTPPGAPAPTMKTLDQIESRTPISSLPTTITLSGSYYLIQNLTGVSGSNGIAIEVTDVTIDLNGFSLIGVPGSLDGIFVPDVNNVIRNIKIFNGTVSNWGGDGIHLKFASENIFQDLHLMQNSGIGIIAGTTSNYFNCVAQLNGSHGFSLGSNSVLNNCLTHLNQGHGITTTLDFISNVGSGTSALNNCSGFKNSLAGFNLGDQFIVSNCSSFLNSGAGFVVGSASVVSNCTSTSNTLNGYLIGDGSNISDSTSSYNDVHGISMGKGGLVSNCVAMFNGDHGIAVDEGSTIVNCTSSHNTSDGFLCNNDVKISNSNSNLNGGNGISLTSHCFAYRNSSTRNSSGSGIKVAVAGGSNHIEGNHLTANSKGIEAVNGGNIIIGNTAKGNTDNYGSIGVGNTVGPIVNSSNIATNNNPHANYEF